MKASYLVIVLFLSDITLTSGDDFCGIIVGSSIAAAATGVFLFFVFAVSSKPDNLLPFDPKREHTLYYSIFFYIFSFLLFTTVALLFSQMLFVMFYSMYSKYNLKTTTLFLPRVGKRFKSKFLWPAHRVRCCTKSCIVIYD